MNWILITIDLLPRHQVELQEKLRAAEAKEADLEVTSVRVREEMKRGYEDEAQKLREQVKQHSLTICAMEERLNKVVRKNKEAQTEINHLKKTIQGTTQGWVVSGVMTVYSHV